MILTRIDFPLAIDTMQPPKKIVMLGYQGASALDLIGPLDVLTGSIFALPDSKPHYIVEVVSTNGGLLNTSPAGIQISSKRLADVVVQQIHTLLISGGPNVEETLKDEQLIQWIAKASKTANRVASVCTGAFLLAEAGLLDGRKATTHWKWAAELARRYPLVNVQPDHIYVKDDFVYSSAGITAGMDLALALLEEDLGRDIALEVARNWVMFLKRPGGQSQFSALLPKPADSNNSMNNIVAWIADHLDRELTVECLADQCKMSARNFARRFHAEMGITPAKYIETMRIQAARSRLENTSESIESIADNTGFSNGERMRRAFIRHINTCPQDYRARFQHSST